VHADVKSHTGNIQTLGRWAANAISSKQKLNTKISTKAALVAADDSFPLALWTRIFLKEQGHESETTIYQDNTTLLPCCWKRTVGEFWQENWAHEHHTFLHHGLHWQGTPNSAMLFNWWHDRMLPKQTIASRKFKKHKTLIMGHKSIPSGSMSSDWTTGVCWSMILQLGFANQQDQIWTRKATKKGMQQCECQLIFFCVQEPTSSFIKVPTPTVFNHSTVFAHSLELIICSFHKLTSKALASFNNYHCSDCHSYCCHWFCSPNIPRPLKDRWKSSFCQSRPQDRNIFSLESLLIINRFWPCTSTSIRA